LTTTIPEVSLTSSSSSARLGVGPQTTQTSTNLVNWKVISRWATCGGKQRLNKSIGKLVWAINSAHESVIMFFFILTRQTKRMQHTKGVA